MHILDYIPLNDIFITLFTFFYAGHHWTGITAFWENWNGIFSENGINCSISSSLSSSIRSEASIAVPIPSSSWRATQDSGEGAEKGMTPQKELAKVYFWL